MVDSNARFGLMEAAIELLLAVGAALVAAPVARKVLGSHPTALLVCLSMVAVVLYSIGLNGAARSPPSPLQAFIPIIIAIGLYGTQEATASAVIGSALPSARFNLIFPANQVAAMLTASAFQFACVNALQCSTIGNFFVVVVCNAAAVVLLPIVSRRYGSWQSEIGTETDTS